MSNKVARKEAARMRREEQAKAQRRERNLWVASVAAIVLLVAGLVGYGMWRSDEPVDAAVPAAATEDGAGLAVGTGPVEVEVYLDFMCPACRMFDEAARPILDEYLADGTITLVYRPIAILDRATTTEYSTRSAAAAGAAADGAMIDEFVEAMMARQPAQGTAGLSDQEIVEIGREVGLTDPQFEADVTAGTYRDWATANTRAAAERGVAGTPTVFVAGSQIELSVPGLVGAIEAAR